jgi:MoxR-like ATPase
MELRELAELADRLVGEVERAVVGKREQLELVLLGLLADGHVLLEDVPGLAKTLTARSFAEASGLGFSRVQFTPDLLPADVTGSSIWNQRDADFEFREGPIFTHLLLADEINRAPPKTQAALLEAMQERQVTTDGVTRPLERPFLVLATQNPIEYEGTYPLPEAQLDRFMFNVFVDYPSEAEEFAIVRQTTTDLVPAIERTLSQDDVSTLQSFVRKVPVADHVIRYAMQFARLSRGGNGNVPDFIRKYVSWGAGPRASQYLILGAKARAVLHGRPYVSTEDVLAVARPVLRHRIITNFNAEAEGIKSDEIVRRLAELIPNDPGRLEVHGKMPEIFKTAESA